MAINGKYGWPHKASRFELNEEELRSNDVAETTLSFINHRAVEGRVAIDNKLASSTVKMVADYLTSAN